MGDINWGDKCWVTTIYLVRDDGRVLLNMNLNLKEWVPIGGHIDSGETPFDAISREVEEETGFSFDFIPFQENTSSQKVNVYHPLWVQTEKVPHHNMHINIVFVGHCTKWSDKKATDENEQLRWFSREEIETEVKLEGVKKGALAALELFSKTQKAK